MSVDETTVRRRHLRHLRRRALCLLGVHTSVSPWGASREIWCNHCRTVTSRG